MTLHLEKTPTPPYYAVIFTSLRNADDGEDYAVLAERMVELAKQQPGYLGHESVRDSLGVGITVSYWQSEEAIRAWKANLEHLEAQRRGRRDFYAGFEVRIAKVERAYSFAAASA
ncbi:antibiotic biosynthesis monooxygenase family protein [Methylovirgula sp. 4M-Z18]|uniref:antibiotic biosynthesis monooxygenase family protein n=1 Tax=Methylovirgula sp. 4M-Z18 TaxID=2293567 RepID=UPI000E2F48C3|nr:antibiotic biosynthesis monooxygenase [Methylovirgula sp. 4M-Z18]RFB78743.1 antibiotic biosynthesis monooxygenase [Methylovirgula sp. 4M-Z18]